MATQAKRYAPGYSGWPVQARKDLIVATKYEVYLSGINSAGNRAKAVGCNDLRAEILNNGFQQSMKRTAEEILTPIGKSIQESSIASSSQEAAEAELRVAIRALGQPYAAVLELKLALYTVKEIARIIEQRAEAYQACATALRDGLAAAEASGDEFDSETHAMLKAFEDASKKLSGIRPQDVQPIAIEAAAILGL